MQIDFLISRALSIYSKPDDAVSSEIAEDLSIPKNRAYRNRLCVR